MQFTSIVFCFLLATKEHVKNEVEQSGFSSRFKFLIGKFVRDLIISQILLKMPDFEQRAVKG